MAGELDSSWPDGENSGILFGNIDTKTNADMSWYASGISVIAGATVFKETKLFVGYFIYFILNSFLGACSGHNREYYRSQWKRLCPHHEISKVSNTES